MSQSHFDVVVVGAGCAGLTAAIGLARAGFGVAVVEAAAYPGAENWSGCVYFCENLAHPDILGPEGVDALAWERRLVERGLFTCDGHGLLGMTYRDAGAFRHCYTVLRPIFDHHLAQIALQHGICLLNATTAESLIRDDNRVIGVCTQRGPLYGDLIFLAEGDASHLVTREGYERFTDPREAPRFLQGIKQIIELPPGAIEERFDVGPEEGIAYELLVRNGTLRGKSVRLNMGGFVYSNRQSLSIGLVLPADNLHEGFGGDPSLLIEWLEGLPALQPWLRDGKRGPFGAKVIRGGGAKDIPVLIDDGLAIGGAASAIGVDFPYPNFTGPATAMGLLIARAASNIRAERGRFTRESLRKHYLEPLQRTHYWQDVEFLRRWPEYVKKTRVFFGPNIDLALGSAYIWTRPKRWRMTKWIQWQRLLAHASNPKRWRELQEDLDHLGRALRLRTVVKTPSLGRLLLDGTVNALRDIFRHPRPNLPRAGRIRLHYSVAGGAEPAGVAPAMFGRWLARLAPVLASAAKTVYANDATPLSVKLSSAVQLLFKQVNILDVLTTALLSLAAALTSAVLTTWDRLGRFFRRGKPGPGPRGIYAGYARSLRKATDLTPVVTPAAQHWEERLGQLAYDTVKPSHIHVLWPRLLPKKNDIVQAGLWHVCPAHVYEARVNSPGQLQIVVNFENCIKCETCWRTSPDVDWGRDGRHRFLYPVRSPALPRLIAAANAAGLTCPCLPSTGDWWDRSAADPSRHVSETDPVLDGQYQGVIARLNRLLTIFENKLKEFDSALEEEPRTIDRTRADYLEMLARYAHQVTVRVLEIARSGDLEGRDMPPFQRQFLALAMASAAKAEERLGRACNRRLAWAAADGRQLRWHHLAGLRRILKEAAQRLPAAVPVPGPARPCLRAEDDNDAVAKTMAKLSRSLDDTGTATLWRDLERGGVLLPAQDGVLRKLAAQVPEIDPSNLAGTLHPPLRKAILAEVGRRDPSLAYRLASHLWARDLARLAFGSSALMPMAQRWAQVEEWACFAALEPVASPDGQTRAEAVFVPVAHTQSLLVLWEDRLFILSASEARETAGLRIQPGGTLGLRGAGLAKVQVSSQLPNDRAAS
jgi:electron transfer flavoprotein-quinone oxidoreductase